MEYVPYEIAEKLDNLKVEFGVINKVYYNKKTIKLIRWDRILVNDIIIYAPIFSQVIDWLREKHSLHIDIQRNYDGFCYHITEFKNGNKCIVSKGNLEIEYYEALREAIKESLKLIEI